VQGGLLAKVMKEMKAVDERTFQIALKEPFGLVLKTLAKSASVPLFVMPKRVAETPISQQISDTTGSGPFIFKKDEWKPGEKVVYVRNPDYKPRAEPPSGLAGGKVAKLDRVEWMSIPDSQTAINALLTGEVDMLEEPSHDLLPILEKDKNIEIVTLNALGNTYIFRFNWKQPPFDNLKIRRAAEYALNQNDFLKATIGDPRWYKECRGMFGCGDVPFQTTIGTDGILKSNFEESKKLLKEAGYDGKPVVVMRPTDLASISKLPLVATQLLRQAGFNVDMQSMDWQSLVAKRAKKDPVDKGGWNIFLTAWTDADLLNPISNAAFQAAGEKSGWFGWAEDAKLEQLRDQFARETDPAKAKQVAEEAQLRAIEIGAFAHLGEYVNPSAVRKGVKGLLKVPADIYWNVSK